MFKQMAIYVHLGRRRRAGALKWMHCQWKIKSSPWNHNNEEDRFQEGGLEWISNTSAQHLRPMTGLKGKLFSMEICGIHLLVNIKDKCVLEEM